MTGVVWTALKPKFPNVASKPSCDQVINYLANLEGKTRTLAEEYVRRTSAQIRIPYRKQIESELGWTILA